MKNFNFTVTEKFNNKTLKDFLKSLGISDRVLIKTKFGSIFINGKTAFTIDKVYTGDKVQIVLPKDVPNEYATPLFTPLNILYQDEYFIAIDKPAGMLTHNTKSDNKYSLENALTGYFYPNGFVLRTINRLDKNTCGIVLVALDEITAYLLNQQHLNGKFKKEYVAILSSVPPLSHGVIEQPILRETPSSLKRIVSPLGQYAKTEYFLQKKLDDGKSLVKFILHTGRTHQIRVHSAYMGCPLYADYLYGQEIENQSYFLCANSLTFTHPFTKEQVCIKSNFSLPQSNL